MFPLEVNQPTMEYTHTHTHTHTHIHTHTHTHTHTHIDRGAVAIDPEAAYAMHSIANLSPLDWHGPEASALPLDPSRPSPVLTPNE